jgi:hypothetical protein
MKKRVLFSTILSILLVLALALPVSASIAPDQVTATLALGGSLTTEKTVTVPTLAPKVDVIFSFDLTGSMSGTISSAKSLAGTIMNDLDATGVDIQYGVTSFMDYPGTYDSYGYYNTYGDGGAPWFDYAYRLDQAITGVRSDVTDAINGLVLGNGMDGPQDYTRMMYESYADTNVQYRDGAKKILVLFGDNVPHDNDLDEGMSPAPGWGSTGGDPGRDEVMFTADDLDLQAVLAEMNNQGVTLEACWNGDYLSGLWSYWAGLTSGGFYNMFAAGFTTNIEAAITAGATVGTIDGLHLAVTTPGYESWLTSVTPAVYDGVASGESKIFSETITVPAGTSEGTYVFTVSALDDKGVSYGDEINKIRVVNPGPQTWQLDSETASPEYQMERTGGPGDNGQTGSVLLTSTASAIWIADEAAADDVTFTSGAWVVELATDGDWGTFGSACSIDVGEWDGTSLRIFGIAHTGNLEWNEVTRSYILRIEVQAGSETILKGNWLAIQVTNEDTIDHTVYTGEFKDASCVRSPQTDPGYPLPEMSAIILLGLGLTTLAVFAIIKRKKISVGVNS